jgi:hypothetical protein
MVEPGSQSAAVNQPTPRKFDRETLILALGSLLLPPIGLALAAYWLFTNTKPRRQIIFMIIAAIVGIAAYTAVIAGAGSSNNADQASTSSTEQIPLKTVKLDGTAAAKGISFQIPQNFVPTNGDGKLKSTYESPSKTRTAAAVDATIYPVTGSTYNKSFQLSSVLADPKSKSYDAFVTSAQEYLRNRVQDIFYTSGAPGGVDLQVNKPQAFSGSGLNSKNTWQFNYTATYFPVMNQVPADLDGTTSGQLIFAYYNGAYYYFVIGHQNSTIPSQSWNTILDSLKLNL